MNIRLNIIDYVIGSLITFVVGTGIGLALALMAGQEGTFLVVGAAILFLLMYQRIEIKKAIAEERAQEKNEEETV